MFLVFDDRPSDSPFIERVWRCHSERAGTFHSIASPHWEMAVTRHRGKTLFTLRGPETKATTCDCPADGEWFGIRFKLGSFMPELPVARLMDRNDVNLPHMSSRTFWLNGAEWEYPDFDTAETFVARLVKAGFTKVYWLDGRHDLVEFWRSRGALVLVANARARPLGNLRGPLTCVSVVKALLGVRGFSVTPFQLCRRLMEEHGGSVV